MWIALALLALAAGLCALDTSESLIKSHPKLFTSFLVTEAAAMALFLGAFGCGAGSLAGSILRREGGLLPRALLLLPLVGFSAYHLLVRNWLVTTVFKLLVIAQLRLGTPLK